MALFIKQRPPRANVRHYNMRQLLVKELKPVASAVTRSRAKIVENWEHKPGFQSTISIKPEQIEIITVVRRGARLGSGNATTADLWTWIDETGTRPHTIIPKRPTGVLRFPGGTYSSKTAARPARYGGPGTTTPGSPVYTKRVQHPGFKPRHFTKVIDKDVLKDFRAAVDRARKKANQLGY